ncbi:MAG TPA: glycosyltransferase [Caulobacter sp.]|nr:glycosyltransferase [Caulobacter sp.]
MISVIVQTLNNAATLPACLGALVPAAVDAIVTEVIVVDGGSTDATLEIIEDAGAKRADSLAAAVAAAKSDWLLLLPADLRLEAGWDARAAAHVQTSGGRGARFPSAPWWPPRLGDRRAVLTRKDRFGKPLGRLRRLDSRACPIS